MGHAHGLRGAADLGSGALTVTAKGKRLAALEALHAARQARGQMLEDPAHVALMGEARRALRALPEDLREDVEARGARGVADLLAALWEVGEGEDLAVSVRAAYALAFEGVRA